jgi:ABC-type Fe3+/spermidine/putrescine transport system ATPase subunit
LAIEPPILLLDEPLSNLDAALREKTRTEIRRLVKELGITALFVTHDQEEAFDLADRIAVMNAGTLRQLGTPAELYREPADRFVAGFVGRANFIPVEPVSSGAGPRAPSGPPGGVTVAVPGGGLWSGAVLRGGVSAGTASPGGAALPGATAGRGSASHTLMVRPEALHFSTNDVDNTLAGFVLDRRFRGAMTAFVVETESAGVLEILGGNQGPDVGDRVGVLPRPDARLHLFAGGG